MNQQLHARYQSEESLIASFVSFVWQQGSQIIPKLTLMFSVCRCLHAKRLQPFSFQGCDLVYLFLELLPRGLCWVLCMFLKQSITTRNFALNLWSYPGQLITSDPFFLYWSVFVQHLTVQLSPMVPSDSKRISDFRYKSWYSPIDLRLKVLETFLSRV